MKKLLIPALLLAMLLTACGKAPAVNSDAAAKMTTIKEMLKNYDYNNQQPYDRMKFTGDAGNSIYSALNEYGIQDILTETVLMDNGFFIEVAPIAESKGKTHRLITFGNKNRLEGGSEITYIQSYDKKDCSAMLIDQNLYLTDNTGEVALSGTFEKDSFLYFYMVSKRQNRSGEAAKDIFNIVTFKNDNITWENSAIVTYNETKDDFRLSSFPGKGFQVVCNAEGTLDKSLCREQDKNLIFEYFYDRGNVKTTLEFIPEKGWIFK